MSNSLTAETSGGFSGFLSSINVCGVGKGFFSSVSTCFNFEASNDFTSARESTASSLMTAEKTRQSLLQYSKKQREHFKIFNVLLGHSFERRAFLREKKET